MTCLTDDDCANHGDDLKCCPTNPGSKCNAECREAVLSPHGGSKKKMLSFCAFYIFLFFHHNEHCDHK